MPQTWLLTLVKRRRTTRTQKTTINPLQEITQTSQYQSADRNLKPFIHTFFHAQFSHGFISSIAFHFRSNQQKIFSHGIISLSNRLFSACNKVEEARAGSPVPSTSTEADEPSSSPTLATPFIESLIKYSHCSVMVSRIAPLNLSYFFACTQ